MKIRHAATIACIAGLSLALTGCNSSQKAESTSGSMAVKADNTLCPIMGSPVKEGGATVAYNGKNVGFCCPGCAGKFAKMTDAEKQAAIAKSGMKN